MSGLEEFYKKHSLANILTICIVVRLFGDYFYLQVGRLFYEFIDYLPLIIACLFGWKANLIALIPPVCSNIYHYANATGYRELSTIIAIVLANLVVDYLATTTFFKSDLKKLLLFEVGTLLLGGSIYYLRALTGLDVTTPFSHINTVYNLMFFMVMLLLIFANKHEE